LPCTWFSAVLCTKGKEHLFSDVQRSANAMPVPVVEIPGSIDGCSSQVSYAIGNGRFIELLAYLVEALCMNDAYLHQSAISRGERSIAPGKGAAHMRIWRYSQKERRGASIAHICYHQNNLHRGVGEPTSDRGVPINQPLQRLLSTTVVTNACQALLCTYPIFLQVTSYVSFLYIEHKFQTDQSRFLSIASR
jgi:hypothetical protein